MTDTTEGRAPADEGEASEADAPVSVDPQDDAPAADDAAEDAPAPAEEEAPPAAEEAAEKELPPVAEEAPPAAEEAPAEAAPAEEASAQAAPAEEASAEEASAEEVPAGAAPAEASDLEAHSTGEVLIEAEHLSKYYGQFTAIEDVSFEVRRGQVVAFLGPNGAGKSTTMKILTGVLAADRGQARITGLSVVHNRIEVAQRLGYLPETGPLYLEMTPLELLRFFGQARGLEAGRLESRIETLVDRLDLSTVLGKAISKLSKGYRQRVGLAQALLHEPDVLIMDEPTSGLDPNQIRDVRRIIRDFARDKAILLSTHILQEVEAVADRVVFISRGRIVFQGDVAALREAGGGSLDQAFARHTGVRYEEVSA